LTDRESGCQTISQKELWSIGVKTLSPLPINLRSIHFSILGLKERNTHFFLKELAKVWQVGKIQLVQTEGDY
jgi:hypothetical protein